MDIKVLQGLNKEAPGTTIKIQLQEETNTSILDRIQSFHPIFMEGYKISNNVLTVNSKLPHLWVEIGKALQKQSSRDWSEDYATKFIMDEVIKKQVYSMSTIPLLHSAINQGYEITQMLLANGLSSVSSDNRRYIVGCGSESNELCSFSSSEDSYLGFMIQRDKTLTNSMLDRLGIAAPKWGEIVQEDDIDQLWDTFTKPVVMKPAGLTGGNGVVTRIETKEQAHKAYKNIVDTINLKPRQKYQYKILMQEQVSGEDYRLLVINGKFEIATKRVPAFVTGDGINTIKQLIETTNLDPRRDITNPTHTLKPIVIDEQLIEFLESQELTIESVPKKAERIYVRKVASMSKGGTTEDFTDQVNPQIKKLVESLASSIHAFVIGVDVFCKDITKPLTPDNGAILECNTMPEAYLNAFPVVGRQYANIGDVFLEGLIGKRRTKRIVFIGKTLKEAQTLINLKLDTSDERVGMYSGEKLYIDGEVINDKIDIQNAYEALKLNASLTTIVHHITPEELENHGVGFERLDLCTVDSSQEDIKTIMDGYKVLNLINDIETF